MKTERTKTVIIDDQKLHEPCKYCGGKLTNLDNFGAEVKGTRPQGTEILEQS